MVIEKQYRSLAKAFSWRISGSTATFLASWVLTGEIHLAVSISLIEFLTKLALYYLHERFWELIPFGRERTEPADTLAARSQKSGTFGQETTLFPEYHI